LNLKNQTSQYFKPNTFWPVWEIVQKHEKLPEQEINILICDDSAMQAFNEQYRGKNSSTDVLSFPVNIPEIPILGDIIIDIEVASRQKGEKSLENELQRLFLHGLLHLLGYDHLSVRQEKLMKAKEDKYWKILSKGDM
jgi:probable rRNA maturation factor